jgi:hypothetical protein
MNPMIRRWRPVFGPDMIFTATLQLHGMCRAMSEGHHTCSRRISHPVQRQSQRRRTAEPTPLSLLSPAPPDPTHHSPHLPSLVRINVEMLLYLANLLLPPHCALHTCSSVRPAPSALSFLSGSTDPTAVVGPEHTGHLIGSTHVIYEVLNHRASARALASSRPNG